VAGCGIRGQRHDGLGVFAFNEAHVGVPADIALRVSMTFPWRASYHRPHHMRVRMANWEAAPSNASRLRSRRRTHARIDRDGAAELVVRESCGRDDRRRPTGA